MRNKLKLGTLVVFLLISLLEISVSPITRFHTIGFLFGCVGLILAIYHCVTFYKDEKAYETQLT